jgi:hypothetical protein
MTADVGYRGRKPRGPAGVNNEMLAALLAVRERLGIRDDFVPLGAALDLAPIIDAAIRNATAQLGKE